MNKVSFKIVPYSKIALSIFTRERSLNWVAIYIHCSLIIKINLNKLMKKIKILFILNFAERYNLVAVWAKYTQRIRENCKWTSEIDLF